MSLFAWTLRSTYLHSSMDRFEGIVLFPSKLDFVNLHSSMDRFEATDALLTQIKNTHLHSSMDRFEDSVKYYKACAQSIYIPVWIDLKIIFDILYPP